MTDDTFRATIELREGANKVTAIGHYDTPKGVRAETATRTIVLDTTAPDIILSSIDEGMVTTEPQITVSGSLHDLRSNVSATAEPAVTVNGNPVAVINKSFELPGFLLQSGVNVIHVVATDAVGNSHMLSRQITYLKDVGQKLVQIQGNNQASMVGESLTEPLVVKLVDRNNVPIVDRAVTFAVTQGDGMVTDAPRQGRELTVISNAQGLAQVSFQLGKRQGAGNHQVTASSIGFPGQIIFSASAQPMSPSEIRAARGSYQIGAAGNKLPDPLVARVTDANGNPIAGVDVTFTAENDRGRFVDTAGALHDTWRQATDIDGNAVMAFQLSGDLASVGVNSHTITAAIEGQPDNKAMFIATSKRPGAVSETTVTGIVLDNSNNPLPDVEVTLSGDHFATLTTATDAQGRFGFTEAPVGTVHVGFDGSTTSRAGDWPKLMFEIVTISGVENTVGMPVYIPRLDVAGGKVAGGNQEVIIPMAGVEGAEVIIAPHSVTLPDGRTEGMIMFSQVQTDKVPMPAPNGTIFDLAWTLQPAGTDFYPPARIALPNSNGEVPGTELDMFSFDHDLMEWVSIGPGVVSEDGSRIVSKPGHGIRHSGWGGVPSPPPPPTCNVECHDNNECTDDSKYDCGCNNDLVPDRVNPEQEEGNCQQELCQGSRPDDGDISEDDAKCSKCENKEVVADASKNNNECGDGSSSQECYTCKDGKCGNNCNAPDITTSEGFSVGSNIARYIENFKSTARTLSGNKIDVIVEPRLGYIAKTGKECCSDCSIGDGMPVEYTEHSEDISLKLGIEAYPGAFTYNFNLTGLTLRINATISAGAGADFTAKGKVSGKETECEDSGCIEANVGGTTTGSIGAKVAAGVNIISCGSGSNHTAEDCPTLLGLEAESNTKISTSVSLNAKSKFLCDKACGGVSGKVGQLSVSGSVGYEIKLKSILKYSGQAGFDKPIFDGFDVGPFGNCN